MAAIAGLRGTGDWAPDERPKNFREFILYRNPNGTAPIFALMARVQKESTDDSEFNWWDEPNDIVRLTVNKTGGYGTGDTTIVVDSVDPDASAANKNTPYGSAFNLKPGDDLLVEPATDVATFDHELEMSLWYGCRSANSAALTDYLTQSASIPSAVGHSICAV